MKLKKVGGVYHAQFKTAAGKRTQVTTRCSDRSEAERVVKEAGIKDMEMAAKAGRLSRQAIGHIVAGRKTTIAKEIPQFTEWLKSIGRAPKTIDNRLTVINSWMHDMQVENLPPSAINEAHVAKWVNNKRNPAGLSTRKEYLSALRAFFQYLCGAGLCVMDPAALVQVDLDVLDHEQKESRITQPFTDSEVDKLLEYLSSDEGSEYADADFCYFAVRVARETGFRLADIATLEWKMFEKDGCLTVWTGKRNKRLELPISKELAQLVTEIPVNHAKYLWPKQCSMARDMNRRACLSVVFSRFVERAGIEGKTFHSLRHLKATKTFNESDREGLARKLADTLSLGQIAQLLGHSNTKTTKGYVH
jgi:integrase